MSARKSYLVQWVLLSGEVMQDCSLRGTQGQEEDTFSLAHHASIILEENSPLIGFTQIYTRPKLNELRPPSKNIIFCSNYA